MTRAGNNNLRFIFFSGLFIICLAAAIWFKLNYLIALPFGILLFYAGWQNSNLVFFLLLLSLPLSKELQFTPTLSTDFPDELLMVLTAGLFLCYWLYSPQAMARKSARHPLILLLFITFLWSVVAFLTSTDHLVSLKFLLAKCWYIGAFVLAPLIVFREKQRIKIAMILLSVSMLVVALIALVKHYKYDFSFAGVNESLRPFFRNHVNYSAILVCMVPLFYAFYKLSKRKIIRNLCVIAIVVLLIALFFSYARGGWLALVTGAGAYWLIKRKLLAITYIVLLIVVAGAFFWIKSSDRYLKYAHDYRTTIFHENFREHLRATYEFKDVSTAERFYRWIAGVRMIKDNALTGYGPNTFYDNYRPYAIPAFKTWVSDNKDHSTVHNYFLLLTIEQGIPALLFFLLLAGSMLWYAQKLYHRVTDPFYKTTAIISGTILVMILVVNFLSDLIETDKVGSLFFLCLSMLIITDTNSTEQSDSSTNVQGVS